MMNMKEGWAMECDRLGIYLNLFHKCQLLCKILGQGNFL